MKTASLSLAALLCFGSAAFAQNEVPGVPSNRDASANENVYAPTRMERQAGTEVQQQEYDPADPKQAPTPATVPANAPAAQPALPPRHHSDPADKPRNERMNRRQSPK